VIVVLDGVSALPGLTLQNRHGHFGGRRDLVLLLLGTGYAGEAIDVVADYRFIQSIYVPGRWGSRCGGRAPPVGNMLSWVVCAAGAAVPS
jgi:hypothetical protein